MLRGGWVVVDPALTTNAAKGTANQAAEALPDYGLVWGDQSINPRWQDWQDVIGGQESSLELEQAMNDPRFTILNVGVTDDLARAEAAVRNRVELSVVHDDGSIQAWVDEEYGAGVVEVTSALESVE